MSQIYKKMSEVMKEIGSVGKDQKNIAQGFKFRGIDQFVNALYPALTKHGVFMTPRCVSEKSEIKEVTRSSGKIGVDKYVNIQMEYDFFAEDGSKVTVGPIPAEGIDSGDKATNKALSAALKYALIQTFSIPTEDMAEADLESPELGRIIKIEATLNSVAKAEQAAHKANLDAMEKLVAANPENNVTVTSTKGSEGAVIKTTGKASWAKPVKKEVAKSDDGGLY